MDLGTLPGDDTSAAVALNEVGDVVGVSQISGQTENAFVWRAGTMSLVQTFGAPTGTTYVPRGEPQAVNHAGQIAGMAFIAPSNSSPKSYPVAWLGGANAGPTILASFPVAGPNVGKAISINDAAQVIGTVQVCSDSTVCDGVPKRIRAFFWQNGTAVDVGTLGGHATGTSPVIAIESSLTALNQSGDAVGSALAASGAQHAALWSGGQLKDLGTLGGSDSAAYAIDEAGVVFGISTATDGQAHAFRWAIGGMVDVGAIPEGNNATSIAFNRLGALIGQSGAQSFYFKDGTTSTLAMTARALNDAGAVAGTSAGHLVIWQAGVTTDLGNLGGTSISPVAIDNAGRIIGSGTTAAGAQHAFLFQPAACS